MRIMQLKSLSKTEGKQSLLYIENQSAILIVKNLEFHMRTKHINIYLI